jgi:hypothetical protein
MVKQVDFLLDLPEAPTSGGTLSQPHGGGGGLDSLTVDADTNPLTGDAKDLQLNEDLSKLFKAVQNLAYLMSTFMSSFQNELIVNTSLKGLILKDNQATPHYWRVTISNVGVLLTADIGTAPP